VEKRNRVIRLFTEHRNGLYAYVLACVRDPHTAEDLLQDVAVAVLSSWDRYDEERPFLPWARAIARNRVRDAQRREGRSREVLSPELVEQAFSAADESTDFSAWRRHLEGCLESIGEKARRVLERRYVLQQSLSSIAGDMRWKVQSLYVLLSRTKRALLECMRKRADAEARSV